MTNARTLVALYKQGRQGRTATDNRAFFDSARTGQSDFDYYIDGALLCAEISCLAARKIGSAEETLSSLASCAEREQEVARRFSAASAPANPTGGRGTLAA